MGGYLRDQFLNKSNQDLDLAYQGPTEPYAKSLVRLLGGTLVTLDDLTQVYRLVLPVDRYPVSQIDIAKIQGKNIQEDLARRDFRINAMALPLEDRRAKIEERNILDPFGGLTDLKKKVVRLVSPQALEEDPLRLLRAFRIAAELDFKIDPTTLKEIQKQASLIKKPSPERIQMELIRLLETSGSSKWLSVMDETKLLTHLFPDLEPSRRCATVYYGSGGVLKHTLTTVERLEYLFQNLKKIFSHIHSPISSILRTTPPSILKLAALLHDVAKPKTAKKIDGRLRFFGHEEEGGKMASRILERLRFSRAHTHVVRTAISHHLRPGNLAVNTIISDKAVFRFFRDLGSVSVPLLLVCWADHSSYLTPKQLKKIEPRLGKEPEDSLPIKKTGILKTLRHLQVVGYLLKCYFTEKRLVAPLKLLDGNEVMKILKLKPGPQIGQILDRLR
ncbi:MAG: CCA tRNA nucleotidyltransferase, partial [Elusimicrobia bacterium]|nr:CCA tRNA nucleotidyltransferase [Elusimicrobiota bacterium]